MKKIITVALAAVLATGAAFADGITFGASGNVMYAIGNGQKFTNEYTDSTANKIGGILTDGDNDDCFKFLTFTVSGSTKNIGFSIDFNVQGEGDLDYDLNHYTCFYSDYSYRASIGDTAKIYVKPIEMLEIEVGKNNDNRLRNDTASYGLWDWDRIGVVDRITAVGEGFVFDSLSRDGIVVTATPIEGLFVQGSIAADFLYSSWEMATTPDLKSVFGHQASFGLAYTLDGIGTLKAGIWAQERAYNDDWEEKDYFKVEAAAEIRAVENMALDIGVKIPTMNAFSLESSSSIYGFITDITDSLTYRYATYGLAPNGALITGVDTLEINAAFRYTLDALTLHAVAGFKPNACDFEEYEADGQLGFVAGVGADYALDNGLGFFADIRYGNGIYTSFASRDNYDNLVFGLGASKNFSKGSIGVAFEGSTNAYGNFAPYDSITDLAWEVPFRIQYSF